MAREHRKLTISRRDALILGGVAVAASGCQTVGRFIAGESAVVASNLNHDPKARLLHRMGYGPRPGDLEDLGANGLDDWFDAQLKPGDDPLELRMAVSAMPINQLQTWDLRDWPTTRVVKELQTSAVLQAVVSPWTVRERAVQFWTDHLNVYSGKGMSAHRLPNYVNNVIRKHAMGKFSDLIKASAKATAMLLYLDQQNSTPRQPNENYGRELLELHTLGVEAGYSQKDVREVARCFTGWTEERRFWTQQLGNEDGVRAKGSFRFDPALHDNGEKFVLGEKIPAGGGIEDGERVLEIVTKHPATARYIGEKLAIFYAGEESKSLAAKVENTFNATEGDIPAMLNTIYESGEWRDGPPIVKRPFDFVVSAMRALGATGVGNGPVVDTLESMGHGPYSWPMPDGFPPEPDAWTGSMLGRWNFATDLANGIPGVGTSAKSQLDRWKGENAAENAVRSVFHQTSSALEAGRLLAQIQNPDLTDAQRVALALSSPEFQWR
ncbi:MAG: DUF1800 domain-containing protein [Fimbriimonadaceae bacterium]|nr:DUF1800 domain-containing protein [Fimbriimonadaceae bacterium]